MRYYLGTCVLAVVVTHVAAQYGVPQVQQAPAYAAPAPIQPSYGGSPQKACQTHVVTTTVATPQYFTDTKYLTQYQTQYRTKHHTQYQTQRQTQYITKKEPVSVYVTKVVSSYVTHTQQVAQYVTKTVPKYVTTTVKVSELLTQSCLPAGGYGAVSSGNTGGGYGANIASSAPDIDIRQRNQNTPDTDVNREEWIWE